MPAAGVAFVFNYNREFAPDNLPAVAIRTRKEFREREREGIRREKGLSASPHKAFPSAANRRSFSASRRTATRR